MATDFDDESYVQRWQSETVMFMLKQHTGEALAARTHHPRRRELALRCITHRVRIVYGEGGFLQGTAAPFSSLKLGRQKRFSAKMPTPPQTS